MQLATLPKLALLRDGRQPAGLPDRRDDLHPRSALGLHAEHLESTAGVRDRALRPPGANIQPVGRYFTTASNAPVKFSYSVVNTCGGSNTGISLAFTDNPIPAGQNLTDFVITTNNAAVGVYTITVTGTSGAVVESGTFTLIVGASNSC
jgi:hypothetical protein